MTRSRQTAANGRNEASISFTLFGIILLITSLISTTGLLVFYLTRTMISGQGKPDAPATAASTSRADSRPEVIPPWGELITYDMDFEHPDEYLSNANRLPATPTWGFAGGTNETNVRAQLLRCGLTASQADEAL